MVNILGKLSGAIDTGLRNVRWLNTETGTNGFLKYKTMIVIESSNVLEMLSRFSSKLSQEKFLFLGMLVTSWR